MRNIERISILPGIFFTLAVWLLPNTVNSQDSSHGLDWPQWMGPDRSGTWYHGPVVDTLFPGMIDSIWEVEVGPGYSGPTLAGGRIYLMDYESGFERVLCLNAEDGRQVWSFAYPVQYNVGYPTGPRTSVQFYEGKVYSFGTMGHLYCFDAATGRIIWQVNAMETYQSRIPTWGLASNPLMVNGMLIVQVGGEPDACLVAFQKDTGKEIWRALPDEASYSTPVLIEQAGKQVLVCWTGERIAGLDPENGQLFWSVPFAPENMIMNVASPVYNPPYLFCSAFFDGSYLLELGQTSTTARLVYHRVGENERRTDALHCTISTPLIKDGYVYGIDSYGEARCLDLVTGDRLWENLTLVPKERWANVHLVTGGGQTWGFNELGELLLGDFSPEGYKDLGRAKVIDPVKISPNPRNGVCWAYPAFSGNRIYLRSDARLICVAINNL
jgi:outer membrane protein assembly factor BamB